MQVELSASAISAIILLSPTDTDESHVYTDKANSIKNILQIIVFHLTRLFELRKSCWEICDSQRVWKSQFSNVLVRNSLVLAKQPVGFDKTTRCSSDFVGHFSDYVPRNLFFFPRDFENVRRNFENVRRNWRKKPKVWNERTEKDKMEKEEVCFDFLERRKNLRFLPFGINISPSWFCLV